nr:hypothetical protein [Candidatus Dojkabacteria bacterium]
MTLEAKIDWPANAFTTSAKELAPPGKDGRCNIAAPLLRRALCAQPLANTDPKSIEYIQQHPEHTPSAAVWEIQAYETVRNKECPDCAVASICNRKEKIAKEENVFQSWMILGNGALGQKAEKLIQYQPSDQNIQVPVGIVLTSEYHEALLRTDSNPEAVISWNSKIANLFDQIPLNQPIAIRSSAINEGPGGEYQSFFFTKTDNNSSNLSLFQHYIARVLYSYDQVNPNNENGAMGILIQPVVGRNYPDSNIYAPDVSAVISEDNKGRYINLVCGAGTTLTNGSINTTKVYLDEMDSLHELLISNKPHAYFRTDESEEFQANMTKRFRIQNHDTLQTLKSLIQSGKYFELAIVNENIFITQVDDEVGISEDTFELPPAEGRPFYKIQTTDILGRGIRETQGVIIVDKIDDKTLELLEILNRQNQGHLIIFGEEVSSRTNYFMSRHLSRIHISNALCVIESQGSRERLGGHLAQGNGKEHWQSILKHLKTL